MTTTTRPATPAIDAKLLVWMYTTMERIRALEAVLSAQGERFGQIFVMTSGMEAIAAGVCAMLDKDDYLLSTHRTQAHGIAKGLAKGGAGSPSGGMGLSLTNTGGLY